MDNSFTDITLLHASENGYSEVYKAVRLGKWHVLKRIVDEEAGNPRFIELLRKEFNVSFTLNHPNVVQTVGLEVVEGLGTCIIQEYIDGVSWDEYLSANKMTAKEKRRLLTELCSALEYIHSLQIVHRDVKPANVMITRDGHHVKLIDFGLADRASFVYLKEPAGTVGYASPEQQEPGRIDNRSDIYSLGVMIESLAGRSWTLKGIAHRCLANNPADRYVSAADVKEKLKPTEWVRWIAGGSLLLAALFLALWLTAPVTEADRDRVVIEKLRHRADSIEHQLDATKAVTLSQQKKIAALTDSTRSLTVRQAVNDQYERRFAEAKKDVAAAYNREYDRLLRKYSANRHEESKGRDEAMVEMVTVNPEPIIQQIMKQRQLTEGYKALYDEWMFVQYKVMGK